VQGVYRANARLGRQLPVNAAGAGAALLSDLGFSWRIVRGLMLVAALSATWGIYRTPAGKAVYFTLASEPGPAGGDGRAQTWGL